MQFDFFLIELNDDIDVSIESFNISLSSILK
jgi:hypothetical protein